MLFKFKDVLFWMSATLVLGVYTAAIDTPFSPPPPPPITDFMDINALTQTPTAIHPSLNTTSPATNGTTTTTITTTNSALMRKRYDFTNAPFTCHGLDFGYAAVESVAAGIKHLTSSKANKGKPSNEALNCGRVSCSDNAAIWWCNNSEQPLTLDSFAAIASGAQYMQSKCSFWDDGRSKEMVAGEANPGPDWTVVVRKNKC